MVGTLGCNTEVAVRTRSYSSLAAQTYHDPIKICNRQINDEGSHAELS